jgi:hypothetical protein
MGGSMLRSSGVIQKNILTVPNVHKNEGVIRWAS